MDLREPFNLVVRRTAARGDVLLATPIFRALRRRHPDANLCVLTEYPEVLRDNPDVNWAGRFIEKSRIGLFIDLDVQYELRPQMPVWEAYALAAGVWLNGDVALTLALSEKDRRLAATLLDSGKWATIHGGVTRWRGRNWPRERWDDLLKSLHKDDWQTVLVGGRENDPLPCTVDFRGAPLHESAAFIDRCQLYIGLDSLPFHLAQAVQTPAVGLFGTIWAPYRCLPVPWVRGVQADPEKVPCVGLHHRLSPPRFESQCGGECMEAITAEMVLEAAAEVLRHAPPKNPANSP